MIHPNDPQLSDIASFRVKLLVSMMLVVATIITAALWVSNKDAVADTERELRREFEDELSARNIVQVIHQAALVERCRTLVSKPRIHAALEDGAPELLYPSAKNELRDVVQPDGVKPAGAGQKMALRAQFYRFLDSQGKVLPPPDGRDAGSLTPEEEAKLSLKSLPESHQLGYLARKLPDGKSSVEEIITVPILSADGEVISAIVLGFSPYETGGSRHISGIRNGFWLEGKLHIPSASLATLEAIGAEIDRAIPDSAPEETSLELNVDGMPHLLFFKELNEGSLFPPAYEVSLYPLSGLVEKQRQRTWQVLAAGTVLMLSGFVSCHYLSRRLSEPVEKLAESRKEMQRTLDELRATEQELIQSEKMASLGILTGGIMHELNNPLNFAKSALFVLDRSAGRLPADTRGNMGEVLSDIKEGLNRISTIVSDLRVFCSPETVLASSCPVSDPLQSSLRMLAGLMNEGRIDVHCEVPEDTVARGDRNQLVLVFVNLIKNSIDAHLERPVRQPGSANIWITARSTGQHVEISVTDDGPGIPQENLPKLFDPFFTTKPPGQGTGLGLSTVYRIVNAHGGSVSACSRHGFGAEFVIRLARASQSQSQAHAAPAHLSPLLAT